MASIVVIGATGYAGGHITNELVSRGHRVVAAARSITPDQAPEGGEARAGSVFDDAFLRDVTEGADAIVVALRYHNDDGANLAAVIPSLLKVADERGARLGMVGGAGSLHVAPGGPRVVDTPDFPDAFKPEANAAAEGLEVLRNAGSDVDWFFLSPAGGFGSYNPGERTGTYRLGKDELIVDAEGNSHISGADYAIAFVDELEQPKHRQERFTVGY